MRTQVRVTYFRNVFYPPIYIGFRITNRTRHLGWEDPSATEFSQDIDVNGIVWERFNAQHQADEINQIWSEANYTCDPDF